MAIAWLDAITEEGISTGLAYLLVNEGPTERNLNMLGRFANAAQAAGRM